MPPKTTSESRPYPKQQEPPPILHDPRLPKIPQQTKQGNLNSHGQPNPLDKKKKTREEIRREKEE
jgi:hypothetical protein